jgi:hypothetical protein
MPVEDVGRTNYGGALAAIIIWLGLIVLGLAFVTVVKVRGLSRTSRSIVGSMDRSSKRVGALSLIPGAGTAAWLIACGVYPPAGLIAGLLCAFGVFVLLLSILGIEGQLVETSSEAALRLARGGASPSSTRGRVLAALVGVSALGVSAYTIWIVIT